MIYLALQVEETVNYPYGQGFPLQSPASPKG